MLLLCSWLKERFSPQNINRTIVVTIVVLLLLLFAIWFVWDFCSAIVSPERNVLVHMVFIFGFVGGIMSMTQRYSKEKAEARAVEAKAVAEQLVAEQAVKEAEAKEAEAKVVAEQATTAEQAVAEQAVKAEQVAKAVAEQVAKEKETKVKEAEIAGEITISDYIRSSIFGGVFAIILMLIFQGGLGATIGDINLFPVYCMDYPITSSMDFFELLSCYPETGADVAKLLVWSFLAGFSERMVPGALGKLSSRIGSKTG